MLYTLYKNVKLKILRKQLLGGDHILSLVLILYVIGIVFLKRKWQKRKLWYWRIFLGSCICVLPYLIIAWFTMFTVVNQNGTGYLQQQIDTLTEVNKQKENRIEIIRNELSDNPELLNHVERYLNAEINSNNKKINRCIEFQENRVKIYRWLIYFR